MIMASSSPPKMPVMDNFITGPSKSRYSNNTVSLSGPSVDELTM